jgi:hypothetical protein
VWSGLYYEEVQHVTHSDFDVVTGPSMAQRREGRCVSEEVDQLAEEHQHRKAGVLPPGKVATPATSGRPPNTELP